MPQILVPILTTLGVSAGGAATAAGVLSGLGAAGGLATTGLGIANAVSGSGQPSQSQTNDLTTNQPAPTSAQANISSETANRTNDANLVNRQIPSLQANLGDSVSPDYLNQIASQAAGVFGNNPGTENPGGFNWLSAGGNNPFANLNVSQIPGQLQGLIS